MAEANESQETLIPDAEIVQEPEQSPTVEVDLEALQAKAEKADEYKKYADRVAAENAKLKKSQDLPIKETSPEADERFERLELKTEGYNSDEVDFLMQNGGRRALDNKIAMAGIEALRKEVKSKQATPSGAKSAVYQKFSEPDLRKMSAEELEKIIPQ